MSVNKVLLLGICGGDVKESKGGGSGMVSIATTSYWKDKSGEKQEKTEWHNVVFFGKTAENAKTLLKKGSKVFIEGKLSYYTYEKDGNKFTTTSIIVETFELCSSKSKVKETSPVTDEPFDDDEVPF